MTYKLVKFKDGMYGARKGFFFYSYLDINSPLRYQWCWTSAVNQWCKGRESEALLAIEVYNKVTTKDRGELV